MKFAVIGAGGQVGRAVVLRLAKEGIATPVAIVRNAVVAGPLEQIPGCEVRVGGMSDPGKGARLLKGCDAVVNCALASGLPRASRESNCRIVDAMAQAAKLHDGPKAIFTMSSVAVYGSSTHPAARPNFDKPRPTGSYGREKLFMEHYALAAFAGIAARVYVLRLGHVCGAHQMNSRGIVGLARDRSFALPFLGRYCVNTVHADRLALALRRAVSEAPPAGIYNATNEPNDTAKEAFDWHTTAVGAPRVATLDDATSQAMLERLLRHQRQPQALRLVSELAGILRSTVPEAILTAPSLREMALDTIVRLPPSWETEIKRRYMMWTIARRFARMNADQGPRPPAEFFCGPVPGPNLEAHVTPVPWATMDATARREVRDWLLTAEQLPFEGSARPPSPECQSRSV